MSRSTLRDKLIPNFIDLLHFFQLYLNNLVTVLRNGDLMKKNMKIRLRFN
jgi:hypothetical protein